MRRKAIIALIIANIIWGATGPIFKWSLTEITPFTLAFLRFSLAVLILFPFTFKEIFQINRADIWKIFLFGFCGVTLNITFFFIGLELAPAINASIIATTQPLFLLILGGLFLKENVEKIEIFGTLVSFSGVLTITLYPLIMTGYQDGATTLGNFFFVLAALGAVGGTFFGKQAFLRNKPIPLTFWSFAIGAFSFFPFFAIEHQVNPSWFQELTVPGIVGIIYGVILCSALAYSLFGWALSKIEASETGVFTYLMPITAILIAVPFFGEKITPPFLIGAFLVLAGILLSERRLPYHPFHKLRKIDF